jgi:hypothetical protein
MARITRTVIPMIQAAGSLAEQARDVLQLHRQEVPRSFSKAITSLEAAIEALDQAVEQLESRWPESRLRPACRTVPACRTALFEIHLRRINSST